MILTIVIGIVVLSVLIIVHELGHFIAAKATGCYVEEFGVGFPPRLYGKKIGETIYSINWIPFGGFNKISGEVDPSATRALAARKYWVRFLVISGGIIMNLILPFILMSVAYMVPHDIVKEEVVVQEVALESPAELAGIRAGDIILSANGKPVESRAVLSREIQMNLGGLISLEVMHTDATTETVTCSPRWKPPEGQGAVGIAYQTVDSVIVSESLPFWEAIPRGSVEVWETLILYKNGIIGMIIGSVPFTPAGPVGIVQVAGEVAHAGVSPVLELTAFISIAIAITQLIPFPALDGGRLLFIFIEWIRRGKRVSPKVETIIHSIGFFVLLGLMVLITYQDLARWISGGSILP
ncbi:MAG: site-2 protease family protein [Dehalococcoidales bacterium]|nr:site-2 protease family protein [Dehalococcoidales bacterium]